jgi:Mor family transcriptional regulator
MPSINSMTPILLRLIGKEAMQQLMKAYGGTTIVIPKGEMRHGEKVFAALAETIGMDATKRLCRDFCGDRFYVPKDTAETKAAMAKRNRRIVTAYNEGAHLNELVAQFDLSDRHIRSILKQTDMTQDTEEQDEEYENDN